MRAAWEGLYPASWGLLCSSPCTKPPRGGICAPGICAAAAACAGIPGSRRGDGIISRLWAGEIPLSSFNLRKALFHHCSRVGETGRVLPPSDRECSWRSHPSAGPFTLSHGKRCRVAGMGNTPETRSCLRWVRCRLGHTETCSNTRRRILMSAHSGHTGPFPGGLCCGRWRRVLGPPAGCPRGQAGAKADTGTEPSVSPGKRGWGLGKRWESGCVPLLHLGFQNQSLAGGRNGANAACEKGNPIWAKSEENPTEIQMFLMYQQSFWVPASVGWRPKQHFHGKP